MTKPEDARHGGALRACIPVAVIRAGRQRQGNESRLTS
jgi:hypothetical protein